MMKRLRYDGVRTGKDGQLWEVFRPRWWQVRRWVWWIVQVVLRKRYRHALVEMGLLVQPNKYEITIVRAWLVPPVPRKKVEDQFRNR
jgi:hypothetical protein